MSSRFGPTTAVSRSGKVAASRSQLWLTPPFPPRPRPVRRGLAGDLQRERIVGRDLLQLLIATRGAAVARLHVDLEQDQVVAGVELAQARDPLRRLPVGDARVGQPAVGEDVRIGLGHHVLARAVAEDRLKVFFAGDRIAPLGPLRRRQRQVLVEHGVQARRRRAHPR